MILMKDTALVSVIGLEEIMRQAQNAVTFAKQPFTFFMVAAFMYLGLTVLATRRPKTPNCVKAVN